MNPPSSPIAFRRQGAPTAFPPPLFSCFRDFALDTSPGKRQDAAWTVGHDGLPRPIRKQKTDTELKQS
ncbi:MAG: hypothetical protein IKO01_01460 [Kiritimatiellae bacterium]|nr:hypothetical protein [Kiritimatiellia bacterium]